jgi:ABC-type branched-subunit amino acid transport system substrate-binding protein
LSDIEPIKVGLLVDYLEDDGEIQPGLVTAMELIAEQYLERGILDRPVEYVVRSSQGLPKGSFRGVRVAFDELVDEGVLIIFGPWVSENAAPLREYVDQRAEVVCITMAASENSLSEWMFGLPAGSLEEEPIIITAVVAHDGHETVGVAYEDSLIGNEYLQSMRSACRAAGLQIVAETAIPQVPTEKREAMAKLAAARPDALIHVGFGLGLVGMNDALDEIGWTPARYTTTAFEFASQTLWWRGQLAGWIGLDQLDERNTVGREFLAEYAKRTDEPADTFFPLYCYDVGRLMMIALSTAHPLTGAGVKDALEKIKMLPAATGAPGTRIRFGKYLRNGWVGSEFLVARRVLPDASAIVLHGTIEGLVEPPAPT